MKLFFFYFVAVSTCSFGQDSLPPPPPFTEVELPKLTEVIWECGCGCDREARFPGGMVALERHLSKMSFEGVVIDAELSSSKLYIEFIVDEWGNVLNPKVVRGVHPEIDRIVEEYFRKMPRWISGENMTGPIKSRLRMPVLIHLL